MVGADCQSWLMYSIRFPSKDTSGIVHAKQSLGITGGFTLIQ